MERITGKQNALLKEYRSLRLKKKRDQKGLLPIEGVKLLKDCIDSGAILKYIFVSESFVIEEENFLIHLTKQAKVYVLLDSLFKLTAITDSPQGVMATTETPALKEEEKLYKFKSAETIILFLDRVQDPGNVGTLIRVAAAAGVDFIVFNEGCADPFNPKTVRASMGSIFRINLAYVKESKAFIKRIKEEGVKVVATHLRSDLYYFQEDYTSPVMFIIGNESNGIDEGLLAESNLKIKVPLIGKVESLNAAVAGGIVIYEAIRQRLSKIE